MRIAGRPKTEKTIKVRIYKSMKEELTEKFPGVCSADLLRICYQTSALKIEGMLRPQKKIKI